MTGFGASRRSGLLNIEATISRWPKSNAPVRCRAANKAVIHVGCIDFQSLNDYTADKPALCDCSIGGHEISPHSCSRSRQFARPKKTLSSREIPDDGQPEANRKTPSPANETLTISVNYGSIKNPTKLTSVENRDRFCSIPVRPANQIHHHRVSQRLHSIGGKNRQWKISPFRGRLLPKRS